MDYENKYKEALERARQVHTTNVVENKKLTEYIFPELKESEYDKIRKRLIDYFKTYKTQEEYGIKTFFGIPTNYIIVCPEKQNEQKPINNVEPKFREGEWLCENELNNYARFIQILGIVNVLDKDRYRISRYIHKDEDVVEFNFVEKYYHKFDIQDAKDGDIICYKDEISLFKHDIKNCTKQEVTFGGFVYHCCYDGKRFIMDSLYSLAKKDKIDIHPATKEQRDLLFQKMKEAGYEWNAGKKELKKINSYCQENCKGYQEIGKCFADGECDAKRKAEQKPTWSEEDECHFNDVLWCCKQAAKTAKDENDMGIIWYAEDWLKSLKERIKPQWKPSEEQINALDEVFKTHGANSVCRRIIFNLLEQLKKL